MCPSASTWEDALPKLVTKLLLTHTEEKSAEIKRRYAMKLQQLLYCAGMIACMLLSGCAHFPESTEQRPVYILKPWKWEQG